MASTYIQEHNRLFGDLTAALGRDLAHLSSEANGGRSILFVYPPVDEEKYIEEAKKDSLRDMNSSTSDSYLWSLSIQKGLTSSIGNSRIWEQRYLSARTIQREHSIVF